MINTIALRPIPCFGTSSGPLEPLEQVAYIYGPNGAGKSSIAKQLYAAAEPALDRELFNKEFVELLLKPDSAIPGVFVIRDGDQDVQSRIDELTGSQSSTDPAATDGEIATAERDHVRYTTTIGQQKKLIDDANKALKDACWAKRKELPPALHEAFRGFLNDANKHLQQARHIRETTSAESLKTVAEIEDAYDAVADSNAIALTRIQAPSILAAPTDADKALLQTPIRSGDETTFSEFIAQLGNADWVRQGKPYLDKTTNACPFCQQALHVPLSDSLDSLFDQTYEAQVKEVESILARETAHRNGMREFSESLEPYPDEIVSDIKRAAGSLIAQLNGRIAQFELKMREPSTVVVVDDILSFEEDLAQLVLDINVRIDATNSLIQNREEAKAELREEVWKLFVHSTVDNDFALYAGAVSAPTKALENLQSKADLAANKLGAKREELALLQSQLTSAFPTVEAINQTLRGLGFLSFTIRHLDDDTYQLVRPDGSSASDTLSEGERTLISFLYFYHKLTQLHSDQAAPKSLVAIVDDPVSSLDGETLFVINLLIRELTKRVVDGGGRLVQIFLLTHNAYFFKEATFVPNGWKEGSRSFHVLQKGPNGITSSRHYSSSPIKSNYNYLWDQVRAAAEAENLQCSASLPNAMRRIIENYFHIAGGLDTDSLLSKIPENERWACRALMSWYNDGSHTAPWDVDYAAISTDASTHLEAFKRIFEASNHAAHYEMMMRGN